jgi:hypothetical protein
MKIQRFNRFHRINEQNSEYQELIDAVNELVRKTVEQTGGDYKQLLDNYIQNPEDVNIEGLINDSDIYDFYIKHRTEIDALLNTLGFYGETPESIGSFGLYDLVVTGTRRAIDEVVRMLMEE